MAQLLHACSTGFLVVLSAPHVSPAQEALWYTVYAALLWAVVITVIPLQRRFRILTASQPAASLETAADYASSAMPRSSAGTGSPAGIGSGAAPGLSSPADGAGAA